MNGMQNLSTYTGWEVQRPDSYDEFEEAIVLMEELEREGLINFAMQVVPTVASSPWMRSTTPGLCRMGERLEWSSTRTKTISGLLIH